MKLFKQTIATLSLTGAALAFAPAHAGGPLANCASGQPFLWANGGTDITFNPDQGDLGPVAGASAIALVASAFQAWEDIPSSTLTYVAGDLLPVDVDVTNFNPYLNAVAPDGLSAVVFDDSGEIFDLLFGAGSGILGFAGPEFGNTIACEITEGLSFLNGPSFTNDTAAFDVMVHEFGHWTNFAHTVVNGQIYLGSIGGDTTGPTPFDTFGAAPSPFTDVVETMYPFYYGPGIGTGSLEADDIAIASRMYPEADYAATSGAISGTIFLGAERVTGVNVIARNLADPFNDAVSAISSDFTDSTSQADPNVGVYTITGLTPGADYAVYIDTVRAGGFSTGLTSPLPGPEELYNGAAESSDPTTDDPSAFTPIASTAGATTGGIDIIFNQPGQGDPLPVGDDGFVLLGLPFTYGICGQEFTSVFVNANGSLSFGAGSGDFSESAAEFLNGPPRIAGAWDDLQPVDVNGNPQGSVYFTLTNSSFIATWENVPEWSFPTGFGANTFSIELQQGSSQARVTYGDMTMTDGLAGVSCGSAVTGGVEAEQAINNSPNSTTHNFNNNTAVFELFSAGDNDLANYLVTYNTTKHSLKDGFEPNNSLAKASEVPLPFSSADNALFTELAPDAADIDFYRFEANAGNFLAAAVTRGEVDTVMGLFDADGNLLAANDDANGTLLSEISGGLPYTGTYYLAITFCCDYDFDGVDAGQGAPLDGGRYVLDLQVFDGIPLALGDDSSINLGGFGFSIPFAGASFTDIFVNSNGNITFGAPSFDFSESISEFESGPGRVAPLWDDLNPSNSLVLAKTDFATWITIEFVDVPEFASSEGNNFSVTLFANGEIHYDYGSVSARDGLIGATPGGGASSTAVDMSEVGGGVLGDSPVELFNFSNPYDLGDPDTLTITQ